MLKREGREQPAKRVSEQVSMNWQDDAEIECPYCGEVLTLLIDYSAGHQAYVEDCHVCCRPILVSVQIDDLENISIDVRPVNE